MNIRFVILFAAALVIMPGVGGRLSEGQTRKSSLPYLPQASLGDFIAELKQRMPRSGSEGFIAPSDAGRRAFTMAIAAALDGAWPVDAISMLHYDLALLHDRSFAQNYLVFHEKQNNRSGLGTYILNLRPRRNIVLEVPHPLFDLDTPEQAAQIFQQTGARALFISGTHRCANAAISPCSSAGSSACNEQTRISDTAHFTQNLFQAAHEATLVLRSPPVALSIHGNSVGGLPDFVLSDGTRQVRSESSTVNRLRAALVARGASAGSCNFAADGVTQLCGGTNVQGRLSNGSIEPCTTNATGSTGLFLHIEQHLNVRREPAQLIEAMKEVFPAGN